MRPANPVTNMSVLREEGTKERRDEERKRATKIVKTRRNMTRKEGGTVTAVTVSKTTVFASPALNCIHSILGVANFFLYEGQYIMSGSVMGRTLLDRT
jgi:hypothetical protein